MLIQTGDNMMTKQGLVLIQAELVMIKGEQGMIQGDITINEDLTRTIIKGE